jgi:hypothetical protein
MGDFQPEAQVKGEAGCTLMALICNSKRATSVCTESMDESVKQFQTKVGSFSNLFSVY